MRTILTIALTVALVACSSGQPATGPTPVATYGPTSQSAPAQSAPTTYPSAPRSYAPPPSRPAPTPGGAAYGGFRWHSRISDAQAQARSENKLILVGSTKPGCSLCESFKTQVVPSGGSRVSQQVVGYMVHALTPEAPHVWNQLKANLPRAGLMPLVGIFTPDLRYLTGFGGPANLGQLTSALATARRLYPASAQAPQRPMPSGPDRYTAQLNEYGEYEWTPVQGTFPQAEDALTADITGAQDTVLPPAATPAAVPAAMPVAGPTRMVAQATRPRPPAVPPYSTPAQVPTTARPAYTTARPAYTTARPGATRVVAAAPPPPPAPSMVPTRSGRPIDIAPAWIASNAQPTRVIANRPATMPTVATTAPRWSQPKPAVRPRAPFSREPEPALQTWGEQALRQALGQIQQGDLDRAQSTLAEVHARMPGSTLAREASKGTVAIYNARRLEDAQASQREQIRSEAERNLGHSMWGVLFRS